jgi:hypothetical protein
MDFAEELLPVPALQVPVTATTDCGCGDQLGQKRAALSLLPACHELTAIASEGIFFHTT